MTCELFDFVRLTTDIVSEWTLARTIPAGTDGCIVEVWEDGLYEVELDSTTVTVTAEQIGAV